MYLAASKMAVQSWMHIHSSPCLGSRFNSTPQARACAVCQLNCVQRPSVVQIRVRQIRACAHPQLLRIMQFVNLWRCCVIADVRNEIRIRFAIKPCMVSSYTFCIMKLYCPLQQVTQTLNGLGSLYKMFFIRVSPNQCQHMHSVFVCYWLPKSIWMLGFTWTLSSWQCLHGPRRSLQLGTGAII